MSDLTTNAINYISYIYGLLGVPEEELNNYKTTVMTWDKSYRKFLDDKISKETVGGNEPLCQDSLLADKLTEYITEYYTNISDKFERAFAAYGERADKAKNAIKNDFNNSMNTTIKKVREELHICVMTKQNPRQVINTMYNVLSEREEKLEELINIETL